MLRMQSQQRNFDGGAVKQHQDPNSRHWRGTALALFEAQGRGDSHAFDRLCIENPMHSYRDIYTQLKETNHAE